MHVTNPTPELRNRVAIALRNLNPTHIAFDCREPEFLRIQVVSNQFRGIDLADRIRLVIDHIEDFDPDMYEEYMIRIECYTPGGWDLLPLSERGT